MLVIGEVFFPEDFLINDLVTEWIEKGYDVEVLARAPSYPYGSTFDGYRNKIYQKDSYKGATVHRIGFVSGYQDSVIRKIANYVLYVLLGTIVALVIGRKFDRQFIYHTGPLTVALPGIFAKKIYRLKTSIWTQDLWPDTVYAYGFKKSFLLHLFLTNLVKFVYKNCDDVFVTCTGFIEKLQEYVPGKEVKTAPNWPIIDMMKPDSEDEVINLPEGINFTFTGNVGKVQNLENVILGFDRFRRGNPGANLNIVGDGSHLQALKNLVKKRNIDGVIFWGRYPVHTMPDFYAKSDVLILSLMKSPIFELTVPLKFQTYLTSGKPIFGIINGEVADMITQNNIGFTAKPESIDDISAQFEASYRVSINGRSSIGAISENCTALLQEQFNRESIINELTAV